MIIAIIIILVLGFLFWASYDIGSNVYVKAVTRIKTKAKTVFLTFDDGPSENTEAVAKILLSHGAKATFFLIGNNLRGSEETVKMLSDNGFLLGSHTMSHRWYGPFMKGGKMAGEIGRCAYMIERITGKKTMLYRPPFGVTSHRIASALKRRPMITIGWTIRTMDTCHPDVEHVLRKVRKGLKPGAIILMHDRMPGSPEYVEAVLQYLESQGYAFNVPLDEALSETK
jgi:peptidoglycan/xylan/chitin deacetylase (PgdA/CDA1 family)